MKKTLIFLALGLFAAGVISQTSFVRYVDTVSDLPAADPFQQVFTTKGGSSVGDGLGAVYYYDSASAVATNALGVIDSDFGGQWIRFIPGVYDPYSFVITDSSGVAITDTGAYIDLTNAVLNTRLTLGQTNAQADIGGHASLAVDDTTFLQDWNNTLVLGHELFLDTTNQWHRPKNNVGAAMSSAAGAFAFESSAGGDGSTTAGLDAFVTVPTWVNTIMRVDGVHNYVQISNPTQSTAHAGTFSGTARTNSTGIIYLHTAPSTLAGTSAYAKTDYPRGWGAMVTPGGSIAGSGVNDLDPVFNTLIGKRSGVTAYGGDPEMHVLGNGYLDDLGNLYAKEDGFVSGIHFYQENGNIHLKSSTTTTTSENIPSPLPNDRLKLYGGTANESEFTTILSFADENDPDLKVRIDPSTTVPEILYGNDISVHEQAKESNATKSDAPTLFFDGINDYLSIPANTNLVFVDDVFTISMWVKPAELRDAALLSVGTTAAIAEYGLNINSSGQVHFEFHDQSMADSVYLVTTNAVYETGEWVHIAAVVDGSSGPSDSSLIYVDGVVRETTEQVGVNYVNMEDTSSTVLIGAGDSGGNGGYFRGEISRVQIFPSALGEQAIRDIYRWGHLGGTLGETPEAEGATYSSDFSGGTDGFSGTRTTLTGNVDSIKSVDDWLQVDVDDVTENTHIATKSGVFTVGQHYMVTLTYYYPPANSPVSAIMVGDGDGVAGWRFNLEDSFVADSVQKVAFYGLAKDEALNIYAATAQAARGAYDVGEWNPDQYEIVLQDSDGNDVFYIKEIEVTYNGVYADWRMEDFDNTEGTWVDRVSGLSATNNGATALNYPGATPVDQGGTGATTAAAARTNLGVFGSDETLEGLHTRVVGPEIHYDGVDDYTEFADDDALTFGQDNVNAYTSDFTSDSLDGFTNLVNATNDATQTVDGDSDNIQVTVDASNDVHYNRRVTDVFVTGKTYSISADIYVNSTNSHVDGVSFGSGTGAGTTVLASSTPTADTWTTISGTATIGTNSNYADLCVFAMDGGVLTVNDPGGDDTFAFRNIVVTELEPDLPVSWAAWVKLTDATNFKAISKWGTGTSEEWSFGTSGSDFLLVQLSDGTNATTHLSDVALTSYEGEWVHLCAVYTGTTDGTAFGSAMDNVTMYVNGIAVASTASNNASYTGMANGTDAVWLGRLSNTYANGYIRDARVFNFALTAAQVSTLAKAGSLPESFAYSKGEANGGTYTSDFSAGVDGFSATAGTAAGNIDAIGGNNDNLRLTVDGASAAHYVSKNVFTAGFRYRFSVDYYIPSSNSHLDGIRLANSSTALLVISSPTLDTWNRASVEFTASDAQLRLLAQDGGVSNFQDVGADDVIYFRNIKVTQLGPVADFRSENFVNDTWLDLTDNNFAAINNGATIINQQTGLELDARGQAASNSILNVTSDGGGLFQINAGGNVGIGESSPLAILHVKNADSGLGALSTNYDEFAIEGGPGSNTGMSIVSDNASNGGIAFADQDSSFQGAVLYSHGNDEIRLYASGSIGLQVDGPTGDVEIPNGNLQIEDQGELRLGDANNSHYVALKSPAVVSSNVTLTMPDTDGDADQVLVTNGSGVLSWVDGIAVGGTFNPTLSFGGGSTGLTYTTQEGYYTKIGDTCFIRGTIVLSAKGSSTGAMAIGGLPVTSSATGTASSMVQTYWANALALASQPIGLVDDGGTGISLYDVGATGQAALDDTNATDTLEIRFSGTYQTQ